jgi:hypothetical protein
MASPMPLEPPVTVATLFNDMADSLELAQSTDSKASRPIQRASYDTVSACGLPG